MMQAMPCSDAAARRLAQRRVLWERRLETQASMFEWLTSYEAAVASCELPGWKDQRVFLDLLQTRVSTEGDVSMLLAHFRTQPDARSYLVKVLLRRLVDPSLVAAVENAVFGADVDWLAVDRALALETDPERRLAIVGKALERSPDDPQGERRLIALYVEQNRIDDAIDRGRRLGEKGLVTPELALQIGELLARAGREDDARRLFSELVEFDPRDANSRRLLGDALFRHGWYAEAYDQYAVLAELLPEDAATQIRLARAAAGAGRVDEALRVFRTIASGEGRPGANDPRRWARLLAGFHLAQLLSAPTKDAPKESVERELKKLRLFEAPGSVTLLVWKDLGADLSFARKPPANTGATGDEGVKQDPKDAGLDLLAIAGLGDLTDAAGVGLAAIQASASAALPDLVVRHRGWVLDRDVEFDVVTLKWDGTSFDVSTRKGTIVAWATGEGEEPRGRAKAPAPAGEGDPKDPKDPKGTDNPTGGE
jgi:tetratricopeptide (TPR) repeat protein